MLEEQPQYHVIGEASDGLEAVQKAEALRPDLILLEIGLPKLNGFEAARRMCAIAPRSAIVFVSVHQCATLVQEAMRTCSCARGFVSKIDAVHDLLPAFEAASQNRQFISARLAHAITGEIPEN